MALMGAVRILSVLILIVSLLSSAASVTTFDRAAGIPADSSVDEQGFSQVFDFIVVGAGASGSVVAARLAKETNRTILLLEGGAAGTGQRDIGGTDYVASDFETDPVTGQGSLNEPWTRYDVILMADSARSASRYLNNTWNITAVGPFYTQTRNIGGNQATNGGAWFRPLDYDFDNWGVPGYTSAQMGPYVNRAENATETGYTANRGTSGSHNIRFPSFTPLEYSRFANASMRAGYSMGGDINNGNPGVGIFRGQQSSKAGIREASAVKYLPGVLNRTNLDFRTSVTVTKILFSTVNGVDRAIGVEFLNKQNKYRNVFARGDVILAAGDLQLTKILMNSGIGPESVLKAWGKPLRVVNNIIGQKIRNHQRAALVFNDPQLRNANFFSLPSASVTFAATGTGAFDRGALYVMTKLNQSSPYPEIIFNAGGTAGSTPADIYGQNITVTVTSLRNRYANGTLNLTSTNPLAPTRFVANAFAVQDDARDVARGFIEARRIMSYWDSNITELSPGKSVDTVEKLITWIRANPGTACHYYGSVPMGTAATAPCDTRWLVRGVKRLRIVGPAVVPNTVWQGMQALAVTMGEKGTDLIKEDYGL